MDTNFLILFSLIVAFLFSFAAVPFVRVLAFKIGAVDVPRDARRMHTSPIPRIGGLAIYFGFLVSLFCFSTVIDMKMIGILIGASLLVLLGILDDRKPIRALYKLIVQIVAAAIPVAMGLKIAFLTNINIFSGDASMNLGFLAIPVTVIWIVGLTNALNLLDGLDGLAAGVTAISSVCLMIVALFNESYEMLLPLAAIAGSTIGFLPYNLNPAKIFMGDTGALFLGYILATLSIDGFFKSYAAITFIIPLIVLGLPLFDTSFAIIRRVAKGKPIMAPDRSHLHHRLVDAGFTQRQTVGILCAISGLLSLAAIVLITKGVNRMLLMLVASTAFYYGGKFYIKNKGYEKEFIDKLEESTGGEDEKN
jgi:UDP-GlcNAc:undecaprenyl-phosphate GlcNAc-1-phosphate transferase